MADGVGINITWTTRSGYTVENRTYTGRVDAILGEIGGSSIGGPVDAGVYVPLQTAMDFFDTDEVGSILVELVDSSEQTIQGATEAILELYAGQVEVVTPKAMLDAIGSIVEVVVADRTDRHHSVRPGLHTLCNAKTGVFRRPFTEPGHHPAAAAAAV